MKQGFSCLHFTVIPFCLLGFIFLIVGLVSNNWMSVSKCSIEITKGTVTEYSLKYTNGLWNKCNGDECTNIMEGPPEQVKVDTAFCATKGIGNDWYITDSNLECQSYKKCINGEAKESGKCGASSYFDLKSRTCVSTNPSCSKCHDWQCRSPQNGKVIVSSKNWYVKDLNCKTYWKCEANADGERKYSEKTVANTNTEWWDQSGVQKVVTVKPAKCWDKECVVAGKGVTKVVVTDGAVCEKFYTCNDGVKSVAKTCSAGSTVILTSGAGGARGTCLSVATYANQHTDDQKVCQNPKCKVANAAGKGDYRSSNQATDCTSYYKCDASKLITMGSCSATSYFIKDSGLGSCGSTKPTACKHYNCRTRLDGYITMDSTTCTAWSRCSNSGKSYNTGTCTVAKTTLDITVAATVTSLATICTTKQQSYCKDPKCVGKSAGWHVTDGKTCKKYIQCGPGETLITDTQTCTGTDVYFTKLNKLCDKSTTSGSTTCYDPRCTALDATHSKTIYKYKYPAASNQDCTNYYRCSNGHYTDMTCASGSHFDDVSNTCKTTRPTKCRDQLCYNKADGNWRTNKNDKQCISYYVCTSLIATKTAQSCSTAGTGFLLTNGVGTAGTCVDPKITTVSDAACRTPATSAPPVNPVNGGWSAWSLWSNCWVNRTRDAKTQAGVSMRTRTCSCPSKKNGGSGCSGDDKEVTVCYTCAPEIGFIGSGRTGMLIAVICSILCCAWAVCLNVTKQCYAAHTIIFHSLVAALSGIIGAALFNGGKPDMPNCTVEGGAGFILAVIGAIMHIVALIVAIVIVVKTRKARVGSADCKGKDTQDTNMADRDHSAENPASEA